MFAGLFVSDFEAYAPQKWKSNAYNRERLEVKQKLLALGREVGSQLLSSNGAPLECEASVEHPTLWNQKQVDAQHIFYSRNPEARREIDRIIDRARSMAALVEDPTPQHNHLFLALSLRHDSMEVALKLHPGATVDRKNLEQKFDDPWERSKLLELLARLPPEVSAAVTSGERWAANDVDAEKMAALLAQFGQASSHGWFYVGQRLSRQEAIDSGEALGPLLRARLDQLLPVFHYIAWTRDNDFVSMRETLQREKQVVRQRGLSRNDRVRIVRGMLTGQRGVVQEIDGKGALKVLVGKVAVKVNAEDVAQD
jgi:transcription antitermination factor NusG